MADEKWSNNSQKREAETDQGVDKMIDQFPRVHTTTELIQEVSQQVLQPGVCLVNRAFVDRLHNTTSTAMSWVDHIDKASPISEPTLENLPLEIKDEIFSYLLPGSPQRSWTSCPPSRDHVPITRHVWHMGILLVNRVLGSEARTFLYTRNTFVKVLYDWTYDDWFNVTVFVRKASTRDTVAFRHQQITFHSRSSSEPGTIQGQKLLLGEDLQALIEQLRFRHDDYVEGYIYILSDPNIYPIRFQNDAAVKRPDRYVFRFQDDAAAERSDRAAHYNHVEVHKTAFTPCLKLTEEATRQYRLLAPFCKAMRDIYGVELTGDVLPTVAEHVRTRSKSRFVAIDVLGWDIYDAQLRKKKGVDIMLKKSSIHTKADLIDDQGNPRLIVELMRLLAYCCSFHTRMFKSGDGSHPILFGYLPQTVHEICNSWQLALAVLTLDFCMSSARSHHVMGWVNLWDLKPIILAWKMLRSCGDLYEAVPEGTKIMVEQYAMVMHASRGQEHEARSISEFVKARGLDTCNADLREDLDMLAKGELNFSTTTLNKRSVICNTPLNIKRPDQLAGWSGSLPSLQPNIIKALEDAADKDITSPLVVKDPGTRPTPVVI